MSLKEIRERHEFETNHFDGSEKYRRTHQDRAELLKMVDEAEEVIKEALNKFGFSRDDRKLKDFYDKLNGG